MSAAQSPCRATGLLLGAHLDGQLDPVKTLEVEAHLAACELCRERVALDRSLRGSLKKAVKATSPDDVRTRMLAAMASERGRETARDAVSAAAQAQAIASATAPLVAAPLVAAPWRRPAMLRHWRTMLPLASAAAIVLAWGAASKQPLVQGRGDTMVPAGVADDLLRNDLLRDFVAQHSHPVPPEQQDPKQVRQFERYVGVPVRVSRLAPPGGQHARFVGGRLVPVHGGERAAMLQYEMHQNNGVQRVTVFVYDPRKIQVGGTNLAARAVGTTEVRVGQTDGYSVAVTQHAGVGYALASDLDPESSANLMAVVDRGE